MHTKLIHDKQKLKLLTVHTTTPYTKLTVRPNKFLTVHTSSILYIYNSVMKEPSFPDTTL